MKKCGRLSKKWLILIQSNLYTKITKESPRLYSLYTGSNALIFYILVAVEVVSVDMTVVSFYKKIYYILVIVEYHL